MTPQRERRAAALEAIGNAILELAAVEREADEPAPADVFIDRRNCEKEVRLSPRAFADAAGRHFPAFRVSRRRTATKVDVLTWLRSREVEPKVSRPPLTTPPPDPDAFLKSVHARFVARVSRAMTDHELNQADICVQVGRSISARVGREYTDTADDVAARVESKIGAEPVSHADWRSLGLDPTVMEADAEQLRRRLHEEHPEMGWRERVQAVAEMWDARTAPLSEARQAERAASRAAKKAERARLGQLGLKS
jgi:hypothetical protein